MRWDENSTYQFVKLYLSKNFLWNPNHEKHNLKDERRKAYKSIIEEFMTLTGIQLNEYGVKIKIKNLRSTYSQEINKIRTRSGPTSKYTPTIKWFADWHRCFRSTSSKMDIDTINDDQPSELDNKPLLTINIDRSIDEGNIDPFAPDSQNHNLETIQQQNNKNSKCIKNMNSRVTLCKKKRKKMKLLSSSIQRDRLRSSDASLTSREDEFDIYGRYVASQLRQMDIQKALQLQLSIQNLMSEARIADLDKMK